MENAVRLMRTVLAALALAGSLVFATAAPAHADPVLRNVYYYYGDCQRYGSEGVQTGLWSSYTCVPQYIYWFLYA
jgi:hypothetical protein